MSPLAQSNTERTTAQRQTSTGRRRTWIYGMVSALLLGSHTGAGAQGYDPAVQSPLNLLTAPTDPVAYFDARKQARALLGEGKSAEAEPLVEQITREYPRDGENWLAARQHPEGARKVSLKQPLHTRSAGELLWWGGGSAREWGLRSHTSGWKQARCPGSLRRYTVPGRGLATSWIYDDDDFASLRSDPEFLEIAGRPDTSGWSRDYGWRRDLDFLSRRSEAPECRLSQRIRCRRSSSAATRRCRQNVPRLSDEQIFVGMNGMLAVLHQGHTIGAGVERLPRGVQGAAIPALGLSGRNLHRRRRRSSMRTWSAPASSASKACRRKKRCAG